MLQIEDTATWEHKHPFSAETNPMGRTKKVNTVLSHINQHTMCLHLKMDYTSVYMVLLKVGSSWSVIYIHDLGMSMHFLFKTETQM